jgi:HSP20 family protein
MYFEFLPQPRQGANWAPAVVVCERADEVVIFVEMPEVQRSDVQLSWSDGVLIISGVKRQTPSGRGIARYLCVERTHGHFHREISIGLPIDYKRAPADLKDGLMKIHLPKARPDVVQIPIR